jgi:hypothetical protein
MRLSALLLAFLAAPFWETKPPVEWTPQEVIQVLTDSPWGQIVDSPDRDRSSPVQIYIADAKPVREAELRRRAMSKRKLADDPLWEDYQAYLRENEGKYIIVAVSLIKPRVLDDEAEIRRMEAESVLRIGKRKLKVEGHFPPSSTDPYLRFVFPRDIQSSDKTLNFELYIPGLPSPYRQAEFRLKDLLYYGHIEL